MATIALYADKINQMPGLVQNVKQSVQNYKAELAALKSKVLKINQSICSTDDVISSIQASSQTQEEKITSLEAFQQKSEEFIENTARVDREVAEVIRQRKDDFYEQYNYLKPKSEKNWFENTVDDVGKWYKKAGEWCKEHWKLLVTVAIVIVAVVLISTGVGGILGAMALGALTGSGVGGVLGGIMSVWSGGSFFEGFESGAFSGAIAGIISGGMGFSMSIGGKIALSFKQTLEIGGISGLGTSLISDLGDVFIAGEKISLGEILSNMTISGLMGAVFAGIGYGISKGIAALKLRFGGGTPIENGPYIKDGKPNGRPSPSGKARLKFEQELYEQCVGRDGILRDPNTGEILDWKPGQPRAGKVDFGHKPGKSYYKVFEQYRNGRITLEELKAFQSNPSNFRIEAVSSNRSHLYEKTLLEITKGFPWISSISDLWKELYGTD